MALGERDPNGSGRSSRASVMSAGSRSVSKGPPQPAGLGNDLLSANPAVTSMLRTSTELGNLGSMVCESSLNMHNVPRAPPPRSGATSRMSSGSSISNTSKRTSGRASAHQNWPSSSSGPRRSVHRRHHGPQYVADTLSPTVMSLPGSSPLFPRGILQNDRRVRSLTYRSHPNLRMSARSLSSLRSEHHIQRPRSPYDSYPPPRFRHSGMRPVSPASDFSEQFSRPPFVNPNPPRGMFRGRRLPEIPFRRDQNGRLPLSVRPRSSACSVNSYDHEEIPPVPPIPVQHQTQNRPQTQFSHQSKHMHQHIAVDRARSLHSQGKGSVSSGSTNQRTDSDTPSSDGPSPPTPKDTGLMGPLVTTHDADKITNQNGAVPFYLDGSEYYEQEYVHEARAVVLTTCIGRIRAIEEERSPVHTPKTMSNALVCDPVQASTDPFEGPAELPASPVPLRLTRLLVQSALGPPSPTDEVDESAPAPDVQIPLGSPIVSQQESGISSRSDGAQATELPQSDKVQAIRYSASSQAATALMESSTIELALQYSSSNDATCSPDVVPTEDGISELLDDYQHTETKGHTEPLVGTPQERTVQGEVAEKKSSHTSKSSDEQSFKSCTHLPEQPIKDLDAKSFKTAEDMATPERAASLPISRLPSSIMLKSESDPQTPASELPQSPPPTTLRKRPVLSLGEPSFSRAVSRVRPSIKVGSRHGSTVTSIASSISGANHTPLPVPPRESSASTEAQRSTAVANFLARFSLGRAPNGFKKKFSKTETINLPDECGVNSKSDPFQQKQSGSRSICCFDGTSDVMETSNQMLVDQETVSENHVPAGVPKRVYHTPIDFEQSRIQNMQKRVFVTPIELEHSGPQDIYPGDSQHRHALSTPPPMMIPSSSACSPDGESFPFKPRAQSSPAGLSKSPEHSRCDSQSTTHLEWHARQSSSTPFFDASERHPQNGSEQDDTTTDLPFSSYRRLHVPISYLEDVKEESHEDSSLNTSTSNLKQRTIFRFPHTGALSSQPSIRESRDEIGALARNASGRSRRNSGLAQTQGLPSMNFSRINLVDGLGDIFSSRPGSLDDVLDARESFGLDHLRPSSEGNMREKYKSLPADIEGAEAAVGASQSGIEQDIIRGRGKAIWSRKEILSALEDITVPTVSEVTRRITELFPLKEDNDSGEANMEEFPEETEIMEQARARLQEVGVPSAKRSSARLRPMAGSSQLQVMEDVLYEKITSPKKKGSVGDVAAEMRTEAEASGTRGRSKHTRGQTALAELEAPSPAKLRARSQSLNISLDLASSLQEETRNFRSRTSSPTATSSDTRPWNNDRYYIAWTTSPEVDISFPPPAVLQGSPRPRPSPLRSRLSISSDASGPSLTCPRVSPATRLFPEALKHPQHYGTHQCVPNLDTGGFPAGPVSVGSGDQTHEAGDRYPTSSLSPPSNVNIQSIANYSSHFSESDDDTMAKKLKLSLRDRFGSKRRYTEEYDGEHPRATQQPAPNSLDARNGVQDMSKMQNLHGKAKEVTFGKRNTFPQASGMPKREYGAENVMNTVMNFWDKIKAFFTNGRNGYHEPLYDCEERGRTKERKGSRIREFLKKKKAPVEDIGNNITIDEFNRAYGTRF